MQICAVGEVMIEISPAGIAGREQLRALSYAGDTYNTAVYLARLGVSTRYFTRLGDDVYSREALDTLRSEGIDAGPIEQVAGRAPGVYLITNSASGERSFSFWRGQSPAREMFNSTESAEEFMRSLAGCAYAYFSGVTMGILEPAAQARLIEALRSFRQQGGRVVFDGNYRPQLWLSDQHAQQAMMSALQVTDIALLTDEDELALWGGQVDDVFTRAIAAGVEEVVLKRGAQAVLVKQVADDMPLAVPVPPVAAVVDTTAAGDSFNAGYLAARMRGLSVDEAAREGIRCAGIVISHRGAIVDRKTFCSAIAAS